MTATCVDGDHLDSYVKRAAMCTVLEHHRNESTLQEVKTDYKSSYLV